MPGKPWVVVESPLPSLWVGRPDSSVSGHFPSWSALPLSQSTSSRDFLKEQERVQFFEIFLCLQMSFIFFLSCLFVSFQHCTFFHETFFVKKGSIFQLKNC